LLIIDEKVSFLKLKTILSFHSFKQLYNFGELRNYANTQIKSKK